MQFVPFNSRDIMCKNPFGAVQVGEKIHFVVTMPRDMHVRGIRLIFSGDCSDIAEMYWTGTNGTLEWWDCDYTPRHSGLFFYHFEYVTPWGTSRIMLNSSGCGTFTNTGDKWQLTVYDADFAASNFIKGGIIYQIFPDRFCNSGKEKKSVPTDRIIRSDWGNTPEWRPDIHGEIRNNDYFCGDLDGITEKLDYLSSLGVTAIYLNPIFEAHSNHRYDTANYEKIDPLLGNEADFANLCNEAHKRNIRIIIDGVFSHTGADSIYFNLNNRYEGGAYNDKNSPYRSWYTFFDDGSYESWWGFETLPEVNETEPSYIEYITEEDGIIDKWMQLGADGFRLDVADELPDKFIDKIRIAVKRNNPDAYLLGEVWEDASNKFSQNHFRRYLLGKQLDSVMNYPFRQAIIDFVKTGRAEDFMESVVTICENYPKEALDTLMNHLGTHDTARILTAVSDVNHESMSRYRLSNLALTSNQINTAKRRLKAAIGLQYTLPGVPSIYYGDEAGLQGGKDPFNRGCFPWDNIDTDLYEYYKIYGEIRKNPVFETGEFIPISAMLGCVCFARKSETGEYAVVISNMNNHEIHYTLPNRFSGQTVPVAACSTVVIQ